MNSKVKIRMAMPLVFLLCSLLVSLTGCSTLRRNLNFMPSMDPPEKDNTIRDKDVAQVLHNIRSHKGNPDSIYRLACYFHERKKDELAIEEFRKVLRIDPAYVKAYNGMGVSYDLLGEWSLAAQSYKEALALNPDLDYVHNNLGYSYLLQGDISSAIDAFQKAINLDNKNKLYHNNLGLAYTKKGRFDLAFAEFRLAGDEAKAHYNVALFYYQRGLYKEAKYHFAKASAMDPANGDTKVALTASENLAKICQLEDQKGSESSQATNSPVRDKQVSDTKDKTTPTTEVKEPEKEMQQREAKTPISDQIHKNIQSDNESAMYTIQAGAFRNLKYAEIRKDRLIEKGHTAHIIKGGRKNTLYVVQVGSYDIRRAAEKQDKKLRVAGFETLLTTAKSNAEQPGISAHFAGMNRKKSSPYQELGRKKRDLRDIDIEVSNGNGVHRMARTLGNYLKEQGLKEPTLTNATHFNHTETKIYYRKGYLHDAYLVAQQIPGYQNMMKVARFRQANTKVRVLIGKDMIPFKEIFTKGY